MTKTEAKLIAKIEAAKVAGRAAIEVDGTRECAAARKLAAQGRGIFISHSSMTAGASHYNHFTRGWATTKPSADICGTLKLA